MLHCKESETRTENSSGDRLIRNNPENTFWLCTRHAVKLTLLLYRYQESEGSDFGEEEDDSDAEAPRKTPSPV